MKRLTIASALMIMLSAGVVQADPKETAKEKKVSTELSVKDAKAIREKALVSRLHQIHDIAANGHLTVLEKQSLRNEVRDIQKDLKQMQGFYVYLSLTAIIVILILLLLL